MSRKLIFHKKFEKQFASLKAAQKERVKEVLRDYANGKHTPSMRIHALRGSFEGQVSLSAGGDLRIHLLDDKLSPNLIILQVGTYSQLYG